MCAFARGFWYVCVGGKGGLEKQEGEKKGGRGRVKEGGREVAAATAVLTISACCCSKCPPRRAGGRPGRPPHRCRRPPTPTGWGECAWRGRRERARPQRRWGGPGPPGEGSSAATGPETCNDKKRSNIQRQEEQEEGGRREEEGGGGGRVALNKDVSKAGKSTKIKRKGEWGSYGPE